MDLFEVFDEPEVVKPVPVDLVQELDMIIKGYGVDVPASLLEDLASYYLDPPPWAPWK